MASSSRPRSALCPPLSAMLLLVIVEAWETPAGCCFDLACPTRAYRPPELTLRPRRRAGRAVDRPEVIVAPRARLSAQSCPHAGVKEAAWPASAQRGLVMSSAPSSPRLADPAGARSGDGERPAQSASALGLVGQSSAAGSSEPVPPRRGRWSRVRDAAVRCGRAGGALGRARRGSGRSSRRARCWSPDAGRGARAADALKAVDPGGGEAGGNSLPTSAASSAR